VPRRASCSRPISSRVSPASCLLIAQTRRAQGERSIAEIAAARDLALAQILLTARRFITPEAADRPDPLVGVPDQ
jgi:hypothetical protein